MYGYNEYELDIHEYSIDETREDLNRIVKYFQEQEYHQHAMEVTIVNERQLPLSIAEEADCFFITEETTVDSLPEWMKADSLGLVRKGFIRQSGRLVYPVKDVKGNTMGFCGWDPFIDPKYLDSKNYGYKAKATTLYGMEKLPEYYRSGKPVFVTEGIVCCLYLRSQGFQALAVLGSYMTPYVIQILRRFGINLIMVPDNDEAGDSFVRQIKRELKKATIIQVKYGKDIDGCRKLDEHIYEAQLLTELRSLSNPFVATKILLRR